MYTPAALMSHCASEVLTVPQIALPPSFTHKPYEPLLQDYENGSQDEEVDLQCSALSGSSSHSPISTSCGLSDTSTLSFCSTNSPCNQNRLHSPTFDLGERTFLASRSVKLNFEEEPSNPSERKSDNNFSSLHCSSFHSRSTVFPFFPDSSSSLPSSPISMSATVKVQLRCGEQKFIIPVLSALSPNSDASVLLKHYFVVEGDRGEDIGSVEEIVEVYPFSDSKNKECGFKKVLRAATELDVQRLEGLKIEEKGAVNVCCNMIAKFGLEDITILGAFYQFDKKKLTFHYTSNTFVDFTRLTRHLHRIYNCRIWMDHINRNSVSLKTKRKFSCDSTTDDSPKRVSVSTRRRN